MSIGIGAYTPEGILFGADTMFSDGFSKVYRTKITDVSPGEACKVFIVASGNEPAYKAAIEWIRDDLRVRPEDASLWDIKQVINKGVSSSWKKGVEFQILVALWRRFDGTATLLSNTGKGTVEEDSLKSIGIASHLGDYFVPQPSPFVHLTLREALVVCARTLKWAKLYVEGCGGDSELKILTHSGEVAPIERNYLTFLEHQIQAIEVASLRMLMEMGTSDMDQSHFSEFLSREYGQIRLMYEQWKCADAGVIGSTRTLLKLPKCDC